MTNLILGAGAGVFLGVLLSSLGPPGFEIGGWFGSASSLPFFDPSPGSRRHAQGGDEAEAPQITEEELELFIDVYSSMQANRDLTIDEVLMQREVSIEEFRDIEHRIQREDRWVTRAREALLEHAKARAKLLSPPTAPASADEPQPR